MGLAVCKNFERNLPLVGANEFLRLCNHDVAEKRVIRHPEVQDAHKDQSVSSSSSTSTTECPKKKLRSRTGLPVVYAGPVLPALCIICKKTDKYITVAGKRQKDHLSQAETLSAGQRVRVRSLERAILSVDTGGAAILSVDTGGVECVATGELECVATSELECVATGELECVATSELECAATGGLECEAACGLECEVAGGGFGMPAARAEISGGSSTLDNNPLRSRTGPVM
ncbi:hypothetical protein DPX16_23619 [Anabarilius grahami]|uniref:Uncharacterized protein n=1 Tax=Anabarilius grahami TaxID=495550 RepID=A0A3N0ZB92_ANAGA|nr:hypothetical protein DPX16_23619 [Anabarilius grahami]